VGVTKVPVDDLSAADDGLSSADMRIKILRAREIQAERFKNCDVDFNSQMSRKEVTRFCTLNKETRGLMNRAYEKYNMSARGYFKTLKVARTIADLEGEEAISAEHILEAIGYRNIYINQ
ncbi:MAG: hypothetical protein HUJ75_08710, partial [Parasporobacterium sp.]|nr:hypothetical protein [Parasporobacterium sp.]